MCNLRFYNRIKHSSPFFLIFRCSGVLNSSDRLAGCFGCYFTTDTVHQRPLARQTKGQTRGPHWTATITQEKGDHTSKQNKSEELLQSPDIIRLQYVFTRYIYAVDRTENRIGLAFWRAVRPPRTALHRQYSPHPSPPGRKDTRMSGGDFKCRETAHRLRSLFRLYL